jgi:hypothetical protein
VVAAGSVLFVTCTMRQPVPQPGAIPEPISPSARITSLSRVALSLRPLSDSTHEL